MAPSRALTGRAAGQGLPGCGWPAAVTAAALVVAGFLAGTWVRFDPASALAPAGIVAATAAAAAAWWVATRRARKRADDLVNVLLEREQVVAKRLEDLEVLKTELIAVVSHEFRTPLTSLTGYARTLAARMDQLPPSAVYRCVSGIDQHATRLARVVHNVLASEGDVAVDPEAVTDLAVVARHAAGEALETHAGRVAVHFALPSSLRARLDLLGAHRIVGNVLDNAVKFAPARSVVEVRGCTVGEDVVVEVANRLERHAVVDATKLFEPFVQADSSETRRGDGLGLGLHVARRLAVAHGGSLEVRSEGRMIVLALSLPAARAAVATVRLAEPTVAH